jgi:hypothetical protein
MSKVAAALLVTLSINLFLFFGQTAVHNINPAQSFYDVSDSPLGSKLTSTGSFNGSNLSGDLPVGQSGIAESGFSLIDTAASFLSWIKGAGTFLRDLGTAVPNFLAQVFPSASMATLVGGLSALWYLYTLGLIALFFFGDKS